MLTGALPTRAEAAFPGANGQIAYAAPGTEGHEIFRVAPFGGTPINVSQDPGNEFQPSWSPDGLRIAAAHEVSTGAQRDIVIYDVQTPGPPVPVTNDAPNDIHATWSPDGTMIAFERIVAQAPPQDRDIYVAPASGGGPVTPLITGAGQQALPAWSPDGTRLAYTDNSSGSTDVEIIAANGTGPAITIAQSNPPQTESHPDWSPDSSRIVLSRSGILLANADGSGAEQPVATTGGASDPVWSPDGTRIAFTQGIFFPFDIATVGVDGSGQSPVVASAGDESGPDWQRVDPPPPAVDTTPPETTIVSGPRNKTRRKRARFQFISSEPGSSFQCRVDRRAPTACASGEIFKVKRGKHRFEVGAIDTAGNADSTPAFDRWKVKRKRKGGRNR